MDGLIIKKEWLNLIFDGKKKMEIRGNIPWSHKGETIALIESGSGKIKGECKLHSITRLWEKGWFKKMQKYHQVPIERKAIIKYKKCYAWWFCDVKKYNQSISYKHPQGAVIWVKNVL